MVSRCWKVGVYPQLIGLSLLLATEAIAKPIHHRSADMTCGNLPSREVGRAMFYGPGFDGRIMANGQTFDMNALTAASRTLPLGTRVRVTNTKTGRSAIATITDRGGWRAKNVIADLSLGTAREIGLTQLEGVAPVEIRPLSCGRMVAQASPAPVAAHRASRISGQ